MAPLDGPHHGPHRASTSTRSRSASRCARSTTFGKFLGGSPTNVAVAAARLRPPQRGDHPHRRRPVRRLHLHEALRGFGVDDRFVTPVPACRPRSPSARSSRPTTSRSTSTACPKAPDLEIRADELDLDAIRGGRHLLGHRSPGCAQEPSRTATLAALEARGRARHHRARPRLPADVLAVARGGPRAGCSRPCRTSPSPSATSTSARSPSATASRTPRPGAARRRGRARRRQAGTRRRARRRATAAEVAGAAGAGRGRQRPRRRRRVRRRAVPRPARRLGPGAHDAVRQRRRRDRRRPGWPAPTPCRPPPRSSELLEEAGQCVRPSLAPARRRPRSAGPDAIAAAAAARRRARPRWSASTAG